MSAKAADALILAAAPTFAVMTWLSAGADVYVVKPFPIEEFGAWLQALVRRSQGRVRRLLSHGDVTLDPSRRIATRAGDAITLSLHECLTLAALLEQPGRTASSARP